MTVSWIRWMVLTLLCLANISSAQEAGSGKQTDRPPQKERSAYKVEVLLSENEGGRRLNTRNYVLLVENGRSSRLRQGNRVPVSTGSVTQPGTATTSQVSGIQYLDVGLSIDCSVDSVENGVAVNLNVDTSSLAPEQTNPTGDPVIRQLKYQIPTIIQLGKQTLISSVDELESKKRMDIEVTATKIR